METNYIFGNWHIVTEERTKEKPARVMVNYQKDAPANLNDVAPDWGFTCCSVAIWMSARECLFKVWEDQDGGLTKAVELASALIALGIIPANLKLDSDSAIIDGRWFFGEYNIGTEKAGIQAWNEGMFECNSIDKYNFSEEGKKLANEIMQNVADYYEAFEESYEEWESTWIDGPQWAW